MPERGREYAVCEQLGRVMLSSPLFETIRGRSSRKPSSRPAFVPPRFAVEDQLPIQASLLHRQRERFNQHDLVHAVCAESGQQCAHDVRKLFGRGHRTLVEASPGVIHADE